MKFLKTPILIFTFISVIFALSACKQKPFNDIVTTLYPQYDLAKQVAGDKLSVTLLTPLGSEVHAYEPTSHDILSVKNAKLFLFTSNAMDSWVKNIIGPDVNAVNLYESLENKLNEDDLHYWTDPMIILDMLSIITYQIIAVDPANESYYLTNQETYANEIKEAHDDFVTYLKDKTNPTIFFYGHNALSPFKNRYGLNIVSLSDNYKPDAELSAGQIITLKNKIKDAHARYFFIEELIDLKAPNALKTELISEGYPIEFLELHGFHNISQNQFETGVRYLDLLKQNFENIKTIIH